MTGARITLIAAAALAALAAPAPAQAKLASGYDAGVLTIQGGDAKERVELRCGADGDVRVNGKRPTTGAVACLQVAEVDASMGGGADVVDFSGLRASEFGRARFGGFGVGTGVAAVLGDGDDRFIACGGCFNLVEGEAGDDRGGGGRERDILVGGRGGDSLGGGGGRDTVFGNAGADRIRGGAGADVLSGNAGPDRLDGGAGDDVLGGGTGRDRLRGGPGRDKLFGGAGVDDLRGGPGRDKELQDPS